jgi:membrane-bound lytic murein transglycosylase D
MRDQRRKQRRIRRLFDSRQGRLAIASVLGVTGVGAFRAGHPTPTPHQADYKDPVKQAVASTMVERMAGRGWDLPNLDHERVDFWVNRFTTDPDMHAKLEGFLSRSGAYMPMISVKLEDRDMPHDLIFLALIESGFDPTAYSGADASGLWQFVAETGRRYGLTVNKELDERNHPEKSTDAALEYLSELHERFNSWYLAAAAYNTGENRVGRIMKEVTGSERANSEEDYYLIWDRLPKETRDYVPLMIAAARIAKEPAKYGFDHVVPLEALSYDEIRVKPHTPLAEVAKVAGAETSEIVALNPFMKGKKTPAEKNGEGYMVRVPPGAGMKVSQALGGAADALGAPRTQLGDN